MKKQDSIVIRGLNQNNLKHVSLTIPKDKIVVFTGVSGSGKTTAASLIPRFYDVDEGSIKIGGVDVRDISEERLSEQIAFVLQTTRLFKTSILENVRMARSTATEAEVLAALQHAKCDYIDQKLPIGIHTTF